MKLFTNGKLNLSNNTSEGKVIWVDNNYYLKFDVNNRKRTIEVKIKNYKYDNLFEDKFQLVDSTDEFESIGEAIV